MPSRMFEVMGGQPMAAKRGMPGGMLQAMQADYQRFMAAQDARTDPNAMIEQGLRTGRFSQQQVATARRLAEQYGGMLRR